MKRPTAIPWSGAGRQTVLDAFQEAFARDAEHQVRRLIAEHGWDLDVACDMWRGGLETLINGAMADGRERVVRRAVVGRLLRDEPLGVT